MAGCWCTFYPSRFISFDLKRFVVAKVQANSLSLGYNSKATALSAELGGRSRGRWDAVLRRSFLRRVVSSRLFVLGLPSEL